MTPPEQVVVQNSVFTSVPTVHELFISAIIVGAALMIGVLIQRFVLPLFQRFAGKTSWKGDDILIQSAHNLIEFFFLFIGLYFCVFYLPFTDKWSQLALKFIEVGCVFLTTIFAARVSNRSLNLYQEKQEGSAQSSSILSIVVRTVVYILGGLIILRALGIDITPLLTALGVGGLAVALALQDTLSNLFAGLQIVAAKNMQVGDYIQLESSDEGYITDINWRSTTIRALANRMIIIPNSKLANSTVRNFSKPEMEVSVPIEIGVSYDADLEKVERVTREVAVEVMRNHEGAVKNFEPGFRFHKFGSYSIDLIVVLRATEYTTQFPLINVFIKELHKRYQAEGINIPFPITTVQIEKSSNNLCN
jgi:small-conductance mechanosensitive channel